MWEFEIALELLIIYKIEYINEIHIIIVIAVIIKISDRGDIFIDKTKMT